MNNLTQKRMTKDMLLYLPAKIVEGIVGIYTISFLTARLTTDAYGLFSTINTAVNFGFVIFCAWIQNSAVRYAVEQTSDIVGKKKFFTTVFLSWITSATPVVLSCSVIYMVTGETIYLLSMLMFLGYASYQMLSSVLIQLRKIVPYITLSLYSVCGKLLLIFLLTYSAPQNGVPYPTPAIIAYGAIDISAFLAAALISGFFANISRKGFEKSNIMMFAKYGFPLIGVSLSVGLLNISDRFLIKLFCGDTNVAIYNANYAIASAVFTMLMIGIMRAVYQPLIKTLKDEGKEETTRLLSSSVRLFLLVSVPSAAGLCALAHKIGSVMFEKPEYMNGVFVVIFVAFGMLFLGITEYCNKPFEINGNTTPILVNSAIAAVFNIISNVIFLPRFGFMAAAVNTLLAYIVYFILSYIRGQKALKWIFPLKSFGKILIASALCGIAAFSVTLLPLKNAFSLVLAAFTGVVTYIFTILLLHEADGEFTMIKSALCRFLKNKKQ